VGAAHVEAGIRRLVPFQRPAQSEEATPVSTLVLGVSSWEVAAPRCRDFGWTGWAALITIVPYLGWAFALALYFIPGTLGYNRYGPDVAG